MIKRILSILTLLMSGIAFADVPNTFQAGEAIKASEMNENFTSIDNQVSQVENDVSSVIVDASDNANSISDLEAEVASLKGQLESLQSSSGSPVIFQGFSVGLVGASDGYLGLQAACDTTFSGSKVCTSSEIVNSTHNPDAANLIGEAFLLPSVVGGGAAVIDGLGRIGDDYTTSGVFNCAGFGSRGYGHAILMNSTGSLRIGTNVCHETRPVACCK